MNHELDAEEEETEKTKLLEYMNFVQSPFLEAVKKIEAEKQEGFNPRLWFGSGRKRVGNENSRLYSPHFRIYTDLKNPIYVDGDYWEGQELVARFDDISREYFFDLFIDSVLWLKGKVDEPLGGWGNNRRDQDYFAFYPNYPRMRSLNGPLYDREREIRIIRAQERRVQREQVAIEKVKKETRIQEAIKRREEFQKRPGWPWR